MLSRSQFIESVLAVASSYKELERQLPWLTPFDVGAGYLLYRNAGNAEMGFQVCGRTRIDMQRKRVVGSSIEEIDLFNLGGTNHSSNKVDVRASFMGNGAILHYNRGKGWHFFMNDAWLLGGIHAMNEFHMASKRHRDNIIDPNGGHLTVTGRELTGLKEFGYSFRKMFGEEVAYCSDRDKARNATFSSYIAAINRQGNGRTVDQALIDPTAALTSPSAQDVARWNMSVPIGPQPNF